ncbi:DUF2156 domain-containing protein [Lentzea sp. NPDC042327]|uniref:bifunctional lysylphosphatidylglycerol flippase/synthetase MprF n=1 Tax=Lentzea sp. NPDC042327 TaxID=3154801 RepID=UPI0033E876AD
MSTVDDTVRFDLARHAVREFGENPSAFLALNSGNEYFTAAGHTGVIAYRTAGRYLVQFGGVLAAPEDQEPLLRAFLAHAGAHKRKVVSIQLQPADVETYVRAGCTINQVGASYSLELSGFSLRGTKFMKLRNKIAKARRSGVEVAEVPYEQHRDDLKTIDGQWLRSKGRHVKEIEFLVGECGGAVQEDRRLFLATIGGEPIAYVSYSPAFGSRSGWLHDLSRRVPTVPPGVMELVNSVAIERFREEGAAWLHFGFTPFTGLSPDLRTSTASPFTDRLMRLLATHGDAVYPAASQLAYKEKWGPQLVVPEYLAFHGKASLGAVWQILRITRSV